MKMDALNTWDGDKDDDDDFVAADEEEEEEEDASVMTRLRYYSTGNIIIQMDLNWLFMRNLLTNYRCQRSHSGVQNLVVTYYLNTN